MRRGPLLLGLGLLVAGAGLALHTTLQAELRQATLRLQERLGEGLGGACRLKELKVLSPTRVALSGLACAPDEGPMAGLAAGRVAVDLGRPYLGGEPPPARRVAVEGLRILLRDDTAGSGAVAQGDDDATPQAERALLRFEEITGDLAAGRGGRHVSALLRHLTNSGEVVLAHGSVATDQGVLLSELQGSATRAGDSLTLAVTARPHTGQLSFSARLTEAGLRDARLSAAALPLEPLAAAAGLTEHIAGGTFGGELHYDAAAARWALDGTTQPVVRHELLGSDELPLPELGVAGELVLRRDDDTLSVTLAGCRWTLAGSSGDCVLEAGPFGDGDDPASFTASLDAHRLPLGHLLGELPDALVPAAWAEEILGTLDLRATLGGPLERREEWSLDWSGDFTRLTLAQGSLAAEVEALRHPFEHTFPATGTAAAPQRLLGPEDPHYTPLAQISPYLRAAVISTEDAGFFTHGGFEPKELKEALQDNLRAGEGRGGSTITQQLAKNLFLSGERTLARKLKEALIAWRLEHDLPKDRILELYLNIAEWGPGLYGIRDAADHYFARTPAVLRPEEAAFLASLLPSPVRYHRYYHRGGLTRNRFDRVQEILATMHRLGSLDARQYHLARGERVHLAPCTFP